MQRSQRFCIKCGALESTTTPLIEGLCPKCWLEENKLAIIPNEIKAEYCRICGSIRIHGRWRTPMDMSEAITTIIWEYLKEPEPTRSDIKRLTLEDVEFVTQPSWRTVVRVTVKGYISSIELRQSYDVIVRLQPSICPRCIMRRSGDFEVLVQIRAPRKLLSRLRNIVKDAEKHIDENIARDIVDIIDKGNRIDVLFYSRGSANKFVSILKRFGAFHEQRSYEDIGMDRHGRKRRRTIISLQLEE